MNELKFNPNIYDTIRKNIKKYRKQRKITSAELAEMVDLSHDFIRQIESEKTAYNFSVDTFYKISVALDVKLDDLVQE
jgi:transcriptional regulator with XRE-family HTH domain